MLPNSDFVLTELLRYLIEDVRNKTNCSQLYYIQLIGLIFSGATLHAMFVKKKVTKEGEVIPFHQHHMEIKTECEDHDQFIFLAWPIRIVHHIDSNSPLWNTSAEQLLTEDFEIIVILEGCIESSGMTTQIRTS